MRPGTHCIAALAEPSIPHCLLCLPSNSNQTRANPSHPRAGYWQATFSANVARSARSARPYKLLSKTCSERALSMPACRRASIPGFGRDSLGHPRAAINAAQAGRALWHQVTVSSWLITHLTALRCTQVVSDLGLLTLSNSVAWQRNAQPADPASVLLDTAVVSLKGLGAVVDADGHRGGNIVREYEEGLKVCYRLLVPSHFRPLKV